MVERLLAQDSVNAMDMGSFSQGTEINPSSIPAIAAMVSRSGHVRALVINLGMRTNGGPPARICGESVARFHEHLPNRLPESGVHSAG
jgi:hypothetical protein